MRFYYLADEDRDEVVRTGFASLFWATTIAALIALPFAEPISEALLDSAQPDLVRIAIGGLWIFTLYEYLVTLFRLDERAKAYFAFTMANVLAGDPADGLARRRPGGGRAGPAARPVRRRRSRSSST